MRRALIPVLKPIKKALEQLLSCPSAFFGAPLKQDRFLIDSDRNRVLHRPGASQPALMAVGLTELGIMQKDFAEAKSCRCGAALLITIIFLDVGGRREYR